MYPKRGGSFNVVSSYWGTQVRERHCYMHGRETVKMVRVKIPVSPFL